MRTREEKKRTVRPQSRNCENAIAKKIRTGEARKNEDDKRKFARLLDELAAQIATIGQRPELLKRKLEILDKHRPRSKLRHTEICTRF